METKSAIIYINITKNYIGSLSLIRFCCLNSEPIWKKYLLSKLARRKLSGIRVSFWFIDKPWKLIFWFTKNTICELPSRTCVIAVFFVLLLKKQHWLYPFSCRVYCNRLGRLYEESLVVWHVYKSNILSGSGSLYSELATT